MVASSFGLQQMMQTCLIAQERLKPSAFSPAVEFQYSIGLSTLTRVTSPSQEMLSTTTIAISITFVVATTTIFKVIL